MRNDVWKTISFRQSKEEVKGKSNEEEEENVRITKRQPSIEFVGQMLNRPRYRSVQIDCLKKIYMVNSDPFQLPFRPVRSDSNSRRELDWRERLIEKDVAGCRSLAAVPLFRPTNTRTRR